MKLRNALSFPSLGIDLIEIKKARSFYRSNARRLDSFFSRTERAFIRRGRRPHERTAILLAAKEAVFKAMSLPWMGVSGFKDISVRPLRKGLKISFIKNKNYVVASCHFERSEKSHQVM